MTDDFPPGEVRAGAQRVLPHLIVVAGLTGAGKSTFIQSTVRGTLPSSIAALLPQDVARWPELPAKAAKAWLPGLLRDAPSLPGAILHYDLHHLYKAGLDHPSRGAILVARRVTVVNVMPTIDRLTTQFNQRESKALLLRIPYGKKAEEAKRISRRRSEVLTLYATPGWAEQLLSSWRTFVREAAAGAYLTIIDVEPEGTIGAAPAAWRLKPADLAETAVEVRPGKPI